jgi:hypothetical protein
MVPRRGLGWVASVIMVVTTFPTLREAVGWFYPTDRGGEQHID